MPIDYMPTVQDLHEYLDDLNKIRKDLGSDELFVELCEEALCGVEEEA